MKLNWQELKSYHSKGILDGIITKLGMTPSDILDAVYEQVTWYEDEIEYLEEQNIKLSDMIDNLKTET